MDRWRLLVHVLDQLANPAVTIARTLSDSFAGIKPSSVPMFIFMQLIGTAIALALISVLYPITTPETEHA